jgi:hypothetical protein
MKTTVIDAHRAAGYSLILCSESQVARALIRDELRQIRSKLRWQVVFAKLPLRKLAI